MRKLGLVVMVLALCLGMWAQKKETPSSDITIMVIKATNGKPVRNAAVVLHPVNEEGKQEAGGIELKTDQEGKTGYSGLPYGKLRIQVIARGFQTFGNDFEIKEPQQAIEVKLKPPAGQFSIYDNTSKPGDPKK
jgi:hypothetical protein